MSSPASSEFPVPNLPQLGDNAEMGTAAARRTEAAGPAIDGDTIFTGAVLKQIRESQRITLKEISERTRISVGSLSALEDERYEDLPNARVYIRGFVRCLALEIGLDRDQVAKTYVPRWESWYEDHQPLR